MKKDLRDTTFIIPVRVESEDREFNLRFVVEWIIDHLDTNIFILESGPRENVPKILGLDHNTSQLYNIYMGYSYCDSPVFHRTRLLNEMLARVTTPVVVNYDCDILLDPQQYVNARDRVLSGADLVYPYYLGESQRKIEPVGKSLLTRKCTLSSIPTEKWQSRCGHAQFFKTDSYREGGMENEGFISYGAEDTERMLRFQKLGYNVQWMENEIYHIEHSRGQNSSPSNPHFGHNEDLYRSLGYLNPHQLRDYYNTAEYLKKYQRA